MGPEAGPIPGNGEYSSWPLLDKEHCFYSFHKAFQPSRDPFRLPFEQVKSFPTGFTRDSIISGVPFVPLLGKKLLFRLVSYWTFQYEIPAGTIPFSFRMKIFEPFSLIYLTPGPPLHFPNEFIRKIQEGSQE